MNPTNPELTAYFDKKRPFQEGLIELRRIMLSFDVKEEKKWYQPVYTFGGKNLFIIGNFKDNFVLSFFKGAVLQGFDSLLEFPGENSRSSKVIRFRSKEEVLEKETEIKKAVEAMIEAEKKGVQLPKAQKAPLEYPEELSIALTQDIELKKAFESLTPGRRNSWVLHFSSAKQTATRTSRIEKAYEDILKGKGHNEDYKKKK